MLVVCNLQGGQEGEGVVVGLDEAELSVEGGEGDLGEEEEAGGSGEVSQEAGEEVFDAFTPASHGTKYFFMQVEDGRRKLSSLLHLAFCKHNDNYIEARR